MAYAASSSAIARSSSSVFGALPCQAWVSSMNETPLPLMVCAMITFGRVCSASHFSKCYRAFYGRTPYRERGVPVISTQNAAE